MKLMRFLLLLILAVAIGGAAQALPITLTLDPSSVSLTPGQTLTVDVVVDGLIDEEESEIALESFDLDLSFDNTRLSFVSLSFGSSLGDPNDGGETFLTGPGSPNVNGVVEMGEFSFLSEAQLLALQSAPFVIATLEFTALANPGVALLEFINLGSSSLGGVAGAALGEDLQTPSALNVTIVPEPGALLLLSLAGLLAGGRRGPRS